MAELLSSAALLYFFLLLLLPPLLLFTRKLFFTKKLTITSQPPELPGTYPLLGSFIAFQSHSKDLLEWLTTLLHSSPTSTITARHPLGAGVHIITANPANVEHILKTKFSSYPKGSLSETILSDLFGQGIFNVDGNEWRFQRQITAHEFNTKLMRKFIHTVIDKELNTRLLPILEGAEKMGRVLDLQDVLKRFTFDNICEIAYGYDAESLLPSLPESPSSKAFDTAFRILDGRFSTFFPLLWRVKRFLNIGSERELKQSVTLVRDFARSRARKKIKQAARLNNNNPDDSILPSNFAQIESESDLDFMSRFILAGHDDEKFLTDLSISIILAGRDTTSATLTWFFWLISKHHGVEKKIIDEIRSNQTTEQQRDMIYLQAALFESMRLYPPVPGDFKQAVEDDTWPDGTFVRAGTTVEYQIYCMGRMERIWGSDWSEFKPERWLGEKEGEDGIESKMSFVSKDPYSYPVFQAGPRICLGKEMGVLQMKRVAGEVLKRFRVVPAFKEGFQPVYLPYMTAEMEDGFPVKFEKRGIDWLD